MRGFALPASVFAAVLLAAACSSSPGTVSGDAYIVTESGGQVGFGGMPIRIIPESEAIDTLLAQACPRHRGQPEAPDTAAQTRAWQRRAQILGARVSRTLATDRAAHYVIDTISPGRYRLWADTAYGGTRWTWLEPVRIESGDSIHLNLSNANPDENPFRCRY
ncbi:hypothetical protein [Longimicrobium sp.]|uniref:hypothetical protein n=1 Tax=Longimicrobium sp. TaxID=2029185 RepID=UPI002C73DC44|nr:hypothetical protein [Longimicrobium sp.]HSU18060.1 hypothetical protein [Longimicrobium sp.]